MDFLSADPAVAELLRTDPHPIRIFPDYVPQGADRDAQGNRLPSIVYEVLGQRENFALYSGPDSLPDMTLLLECRAASRRVAKLLRQRVLESRGPDPDGRQLNGFAGSLGNGYVAQKVMAENSYYDIEQPVQATDRPIHIASVELRIAWNNL